MRRKLSAGLLLVGAAVALAGCGDHASGASELTVRMHYSHFEPGVLTVSAGEPVTIRLQNDDPIEHEWIVGDEAVHEMHRSGTHAVHDEIPTEVTVPPLSEKTTTVTFDEPGEYAFICHLPGHEAYGMRGVVHVR